ncbi:hypothetical protein ACWZHB_09000 [Nocardia sp. FBN12]|uniref:hypothetical protein n=1 Tax=Nocardia sp. FBN12 TaxID=3419766 RepID=UPI003CFED9EB
MSDSNQTRPCPTPGHILGKEVVGTVIEAGAEHVEYGFRFASHQSTLPEQQDCVPDRAEAGNTGDTSAK